MAREHPTDDTYQTGLEQQAAEHHEDGAGAPSEEMVESARAHHEAGADAPSDDARPGSPEADAPAP